MLSAQRVIRTCFVSPYEKKTAKYITYRRTEKLCICGIPEVIRAISSRKSKNATEIALRNQ